MNTIELTNKEQYTYDIIVKVVNGDITRKEAEFELNKSRQQIYRLIKIYDEEGKKGFIHKNRGRNNPNKKDSNMIEELENLYLTKYYYFNFEHFYQKIKDEYDISYPSLHRIFLEDDIISPLAHKGTRQLYNERMNNATNGKENISEEKIELFKC